MSFMTWNDSMSVGISEIDNQHKQLIAIINNLAEAMRARRSNEELGKILAELSRYTLNHFSLEERYFRQFGYPDAAAHIAQHKDFISKVSTFSADFASGKLAISIEVMNFLSDWLVKHIKGTDKQYGPFLKEKGLA